MNIEKLSKQELIDYILKTESNLYAIIDRKDNIIKLYKRKNELIKLYVNDKVSPEDINEEILEINKALRSYLEAKDEND